MKNQKLIRPAPTTFNMIVPFYRECAHMSDSELSKFLENLPDNYDELDLWGY